MESTSVAELLPTVGEVLQLPAVQQGHPFVATTSAFEDIKVSWIHVCEQADLPRFVDAGNLILTSGLGLHTSDGDWMTLMESLKECGASGLFYEIGVTGSQPSAESIEFANEIGLPVVILQESTRFVAVTESFHLMLLDRHVLELRRLVDAHDALMRVTVNQDPVQDILDVGARALGCCVLLEDAAHRILHVSAEEHGIDIRAQWPQERSLATGRNERLTIDARHGAVVVQLSINSVLNGRLIALFKRPITDTDVLLAEQAALALEIRHLIEGQQQIGYKAQSSLLAALLDGTYRRETNRLRLEPLGLFNPGTSFLACVIQLVKPEDRNSAARNEHLMRLRDLLRKELRKHKMLSLVGSGGESQLQAVFFRQSFSFTRAFLTSLHAGLARACEATGIQITMGYGSSVTAPDSIARSLHEARQVLDARHGEIRSDAGPDTGYFWVQDMQISGLLQLLEADPRLQHFTIRQIEGLLRLQPDERSTLMKTLAVYLDNGRNKAVASRDLHISRPTLYQRIDRICRLLETDIDDPEAALSLQVALRAYATFSV